MDCWDTLERFQKVMGGTWSRYIQKQVVLLNVASPYPEEPAGLMAQRSFSMPEEGGSGRS